MSSPKHFKRCLMILADGARADVMQDLVRSGKLPAIGDFLVANGALRTGVTAFPSTTGPAYLPYLTGCYPGTCNLPGIRWFDKEQFSQNRYSKDRFRSYVGAESFYMNRDLNPSISTLFELIPNSMNIFSSINRGVSFRGNQTKFMRIWYWYYAHLTDHWGLVDEAAGEKVVSALKQDPEFLFVVLPAIDEYSHLASPFHPRTIEAYEGLDRVIGKIVRELKKCGQWEETMIWIVSDHGLSETRKHLPLNQFLESHGIETLYYPKILFKRRFDAASMVSGNAMSNLYFKNGHGWHGRAYWESLLERSDRILDRLLEQPEVDLLASQRSDGSVVVKSRRGEAVISDVGAIPCDRPVSGNRPNRDRHTDLSLQYQVHGSDPFGYPTLPLQMTDREGFETTANTDYPDALSQLLQIFRSRRTGDVVISAAKGNDLRLRYEIHEHKSSHGSLHWEHMKVPIVTNVSLPAAEAVRSADVFPTVLNLLGRPIPSGLDGVSLI